MTPRGIRTRDHVEITAHSSSMLAYSKSVKVVKGSQYFGILYIIHVFQLLVTVPLIQYWLTFTSNYCILPARDGVLEGVVESREAKNKFEKKVY